MISLKSIRYHSELPVSLLSTLSVRSRKIYVFGAWQGRKFSDNSKYLFLHAIKDKSIKAVWITKSKTIYKSMREKGYPVFMHNSVLGTYYQLRASFYFTSERKQDVSATLIGNATRINLWHGVGLKKILHDDKINHGPSAKTSTYKKYLKKLRHYPYRKEYVLSTSDTMTKIFSSAFKKPYEKILQLGQPRNDVFFNNDLETEVLPFVQSGKKIILYMPTHRNFGKTKMPLDEILDLPTLNEFCEANGLLFVVKKHFCHRFDTKDLSQYRNVIDITASEYDTQLLLKKADFLITDYSSCYVDYLLLDRPVIFYNYDYETYRKNDRDLYFDYEETTPGPKVQDFPSLLKSLQESLHDQGEEYRCQRYKVRDMFYAKDNQKPVAEKILQFVKEKI